MQRSTKINTQPERKEAQKGTEPQSQSQEALTPYLVNLAMTEPENLSPDDVVRLQGLVGNQAVARLLGGRQEEAAFPRQPEDEEKPPPGPRLMPEREAAIPRQPEDEEKPPPPGPRLMPEREAASLPRGGVEMQSSTGQRGVKMGGLKSVGDAHLLKKDGLYGWNRAMSASDVASLVGDLVANQATAIKGKSIYIFSGTHGYENGDLTNVGAGGFVGEDQATADAVMADENTPEGTQIKVVDVNIFSKDELTTAFGMSEWIRILAWCFSERSYKNRKDIKSNWWPEPDKV